jgi:hypothetical protein
MALKQSTQVTNKEPAPSSIGNEPVHLVGDFTVPAGLALNDVIEMVNLPAGYVPTDAVAYIEDTDSNGAPTMTLDLGLIDGVAGAVDNARVCSNEAFAASNVAQAGGVARPTKKDFGLIAPAATDRGMGFKVAAAAATLVVGAKWRLTVWARPAQRGV